jgi:hypothetical protein
MDIANLAVDIDPTPITIDAMGSRSSRVVSWDEPADFHGTSEYMLGVHSTSSMHMVGCQNTIEAFDDITIDWVPVADSYQRMTTKSNSCKIEIPYGHECTVSVSKANGARVGERKSEKNLTIDLRIPGKCKLSQLSMSAVSELVHAATVVASTACDTFETAKAKKEAADAGYEGALAVMTTADANLRTLYNPDLYHVAFTDPLGGATDVIVTCEPKMFCEVQSKSLTGASIKIPSDKMYMSPSVSVCFRYGQGLGKVSTVHISRP